MEGSVWRRSCRVLAIIALICGAWVGTGNVRQTDGRFSSAVTLSASFQAGTWELPAVAATVDIKPESLQKKSQGEPIEGFIGLPGSFDVRGIDVATVRLCRGLGPCASTGSVPTSGKPKVTEDGRLKVTFDRAAVITLIADVTPPHQAVFTVSGMVAGRQFAGQDTVTVVDPAPGAGGTSTPTLTPTATPTSAPTRAPTSMPTQTLTSAPQHPTPTAASMFVSTATPIPMPASTATPTSSRTPTMTPTPRS